MNPVGIMQGRLSPRARGALQSFPQDTWREEFATASQCGLDCLEWLVTEDVDENPIWTEAGRAEIRARTLATGVRVTSLTAHYFVTRPFVGVGDADRRRRIAVLESLIRCSSAVGIDVIVVPLLEEGAIRSAADAAAASEAIGGASDLARACGVRLALEADAPLPMYRDLLDRMPAGTGACYDVGNATARAYDVAADLRELGESLFSVHIKDRHRGGASVALGEGDTDFEAVFESLAAVRYTGSLILETPVGDDPALQAERHARFVRQRLAAPESSRVSR
jgi:L-ribulose-5-phosphate 3-epimerase